MISFRFWNQHNRLGGASRVGDLFVRNFFTGGPKRRMLFSKDVFRNNKSFLLLAQPDISRLGERYFTLLIDSARDMTLSKTFTKLNWKPIYIYTMYATYVLKLTLRSSHIDPASTCSLICDHVNLFRYSYIYIYVLYIDRCCLQVPSL